MIDATHTLSISRQAPLARNQPGQCLLCPQGCRCGRFGADASPRRVARGAPLHGGSHVARPAESGRLHDWAETRGHTDARMGIEALYRRPGPSTKHWGHEIYPYLLRGLTINRANQVWALDTTYIPMANGFVSRTAVVDWASRKVLAAKVAITLETCHAVEVWHEAFTCHGRPERVHTDQGRPFSAQACVHAVKNRDANSAWTDAEPGGIMCSSSGCGNW